MREIEGRLPLYHIDLYRLDHIEEISDLGLDDYLYGRGLCVIEWAEKGLSVLPAEHLAIKIASTAGNPFNVMTESALSYVTAPDTPPGYPLPEITSGILVGLGLIALGGVIWYRKRKRIVAANTIDQ